MSHEPLMLEGPVDAVNSQQLRKEQQRLEDENRSLRRELDDAQRDRERLERSIENLRSILTPLHRGLRALFGEIELAVGEAVEPTSNHANAGPAPSTGDARFQSFKQSFPGRGAEILDALLVHGEMRISHLATLMRCDPRTIGQHAAKLRKAGAINQTAGLLSLRGRE